jgi:arylsulfatase A-like enzyme
MMKNHHRMASEVVTPRRGIIINRHAEEGQLDYTSIIFTTDNGNFHAKHGKK